MKKVRNDYADAEESFSRRKDRRKPKSKRSVKQLHAPADAPGDATFSDASLQRLLERGFLNAVLGELKSGKEATVYLAEGPQGLLAAKVYSDLAVRSFRKDNVYRQGRYVADARIKKAINQRSLNGLQAQQAMWVYEEYRQLWELFEAGLPVPKPAVGPDSSDIIESGHTVLMEFIGTRDHAAPRLSDTRLPPDEAQAAWAQSLDILVKFLNLGKVHGDFSTYNLLWWQGRVVVIDFPQVVGVTENSHAWELLERDVVSLCTSFKRHRVYEDPADVLRALKARARPPATLP